MKVQFKILRRDVNKEPYFQTYRLEVDPSKTILECLNRIKWELDGSLTFRKNCRNTICGSCGMKINGRSGLACKENIASQLSRSPTLNDQEIPEIIIAPLGNMPVIKDLVVDMRSFWDNLEQIEPYVSTKSRQVPEREFLQTPEEREKLDQTGNCILCGACYSECNAREVNPEFVGPHALAKSYRMVADSRDSETETRLEKYDDSKTGVWGCTRCFLCNEVCPMEVAPLDQISKIKSEILDRKDRHSSLPVRHRKLLLELVSQGGWIDERKFALILMTNYLQDLKGLIKITPVGWRMLLNGKIPSSFEPSEGTEEVRELIKSVQESKELRIEN
jgi:succinate dehydrogenase / fumarate reductase iron-sulfur subunit